MTRTGASGQEAPLPAGGEGLHVAIIMDGNGRWASARGQSRLNGHRAGAGTVRAVVEAAPRLGIRHLTLFAFSTENWKRPAAEVMGLMALLRRHIRDEAAELHAKGVCVRFIGGRARLDAGLRAEMAELEARTRDNRVLTLVIAINYGGRDEILRATRAIAARAAAGAIAPDAITEDLLSAHLDTAGLPDPDLVIRTSGERRVSGFLPWQCAYSEYAFVPEYWPDFTAEQLAALLEDYAGRDRRFGAVSG